MSHSQLKNNSHFIYLAASIAAISLFFSRSGLAQQSGDVSFLPAVTYQTGGTEATFVAVADFNGDGKPDLAVANSYVSNNIGILLGNGDGTFERVVSYPTGAGFPDTIVPIDLNGDGILDLVVSNQSRCYPCSGEGAISIFLGNGDGTFRLAHIYDSGGLGFANSGFGKPQMAVADVNGDGKVDVVVANCAATRRRVCGDGKGIISVLFGNGDGSFQRAVNHNPGVPFMGNTVVLADLNGDGKQDLIVITSRCLSSTDCSTGNVVVLLGNGDGTFRPNAMYAADMYFPNGVAVADINGDGKLDLVVVGSSTIDYFNSDGLVGIMLGNGDGTFQPVVTYDSGGPLADDVVVADVDGDGKLDVIVTNVVQQAVGVLLGHGDGTLDPAITYPSGGNFTYSVAVQDINGDGKPDILVTSCAVGSLCGGTIPGAVGVLLNNTAETATVQIAGKR